MYIQEYSKDAKCLNCCRLEPVMHGQLSTNQICLVASSVRDTDFEQAEV